MSGANGRRVRVEFPDKRGRSPSTLTQPSPRGRGILLVSGFALSKFIEPEKRPFGEGSRARTRAPPAFQQSPLSYFERVWSMTAATAVQLIAGHYIRIFGILDGEDTVARF